MRWPWNTRQVKQMPAATSHDQDAQHAIERAHDAARDADAGLSEMQRLTRSIRTERERNHFAPLIYESMKRKRP